MQVAQLVGEPLALGDASLDELVERAAQRLLQHPPRCDRVGGLRLLQAHHAGTLQHPVERDVAADAEVAQLDGQRARPRDVLARERGVGDDTLRGLPGHGRDLHRHVDATALDPAGDDAARLELERRQRARQAERDVEVAMIDGARLHRHDERVAAHFRSSEPGHAADHGVPQDR